jgi:hypothetical protein
LIQWFCNEPKEINDVDRDHSRAPCTRWTGPLAAAQLGDAVLAAQAVEHYPDLILSGEMLDRRAANVLCHPLTERFLAGGFAQYRTSVS